MGFRIISIIYFWLSYYSGDRLCKFIVVYYYCFIVSLSSMVVYVNGGIDFYIEYRLGVINVVLGVLSFYFVIKVLDCIFVILLDYKIFVLSVDIFIYII